MNVRLSAILLAVLTILSCTQSRKGDKASASEPIRPRAVLIASGDTEYEKAVVAIVRPKLEARKYLVKQIDVTKINLEDPKAFRAIVLMHAIEMDKLKDVIVEFLGDPRNKGESAWPYAIISTVSGQDWIASRSNIDAVTAATSGLQASTVAAKLMGRINRVLKGKY